MKIPTPNLQVMIHYYTSPEHLFETVTMVSGDRRESLLDEVVASEAWFGGRFARGHREAYLRKRLYVEERMYEDFERKYGTLPTRHPVFFYLRPDLDLDAVRRDLRHRAKAGETRTRFLLVDLETLPDKRFVSFTLFDSHRSYESTYLGLTATPAGPDVSGIADLGTVFHVSELPAVYARNSEVDGLSFEVQIWDPSIL